MTKTVHAILEKLNASPTKSASWRDLRAVSGCKTAAGFRRVTTRMMNEHLIARADQHGLDMTITYGGISALKKATK